MKKKPVYYIIIGAYAASNQLLFVCVCVCGGGMAVWFTSTDEDRIYHWYSGELDSHSHRGVLRHKV